MFDPSVWPKCVQNNFAASLRLRVKISKQVNRSTQGMVKWKDIICMALLSQKSEQHFNLSNKPDLVIVGKCCSSFGTVPSISLRMLNDKLRAGSAVQKLASLMLFEGVDVQNMNFRIHDIKLRPILYGSTPIYMTVLGVTRVASSLRKMWMSHSG